MARSVRAKTFDWDPARRANGAHVVYLDFEDGAAATAVYNGYGSFSSMELGFDVSEWGFMQPGDPSMPRRRASAGQTPEDELRAKQKRAEHAIPGSAPYQPFFGLTVVSCERGDLRQSPQGLYVYTEEGRSEIKLPSERSPRELVLDEFHDALSGNAPALHDGRWGLANLEVCSAALMSSASGRDVLLHEQVPIPLAT
jgi:phthalate 4,5-cis-dihydrodiol dehydrogenase